MTGLYRGGQPGEIRSLGRRRIPGIAAALVPVGLDITAGTRSPLDAGKLRKAGGQP